MKVEEISDTLKEMFGSAVESPSPNSWQVETQTIRLLVLLSDDGSWLRILVPIVSFKEAEPFLQQLLEANFDATQETRYALHENVLWGVFQHGCESLTKVDFLQALGRLVSLYEQGLSEVFNQFVELRVRQIIKAAKQMGQSLEMTLQNIERFYQEGVMGDMEQGAASREATLEAWRYQLQRLWSQVDP
ncbi:MAG: hypothetical protein N3E45_16485 [Oscillatoriaceae bacterium SKW80]|nr:hypothetical protein [Oscillatoriaceae bacterium SKYG93]MCX8122396.1 hypothetical protein [Oscillatoriaceae bacterium SKW80]MDW8452679.1 hypothetical protein [Oscillatoriaceae cyanobacterium SKYGB_i_bin93]HIK27996.1 hypothetical protein [Oscillatoriaceae cyanobacterium M7585_C2015_266]